MHYGAALPGLCMVVEGVLKLCGEGKQQRIFALVGKGESLAEAAALRRAPCPFEIVALVDALVAVTPAAQIEALLGRDRTLARNLIDLLCRRILTIVAELQADTLQTGPQRLAAYLAGLAHPADAATVTLPVSKTVLAARLGVKKETLSRLLRQLAARGLISVAQREITILDRARLLEASSGQARSA